MENVIVCTLLYISIVAIAYQPKPATETTEVIEEYPAAILAFTAPKSKIKIPRYGDRVRVDGTQYPSAQTEHEQTLDWVGAGKRQFIEPWFSLSLRLLVR